MSSNAEKKAKRAEKRAARQAALATYRAARRELEEFGEREIARWGRGNVPESDEYLRLNQAVLDAKAAPNLPWHAEF
jgi:hypothetical protein